MKKIIIWLSYIATLLGLFIIGAWWRKDGSLEPLYTLTVVIPAHFTFLYKILCTSKNSFEFFLMTNEEEIYNRATKIVAKANNYIYATSMGSSLENYSPKEFVNRYNNELISRAQTLSRRGKQTFEHKLITSFDNSHFASDRYNLFKQNNLEKDIKIARKSKDFSLDFLLVDSEIIHISFHDNNHTKLTFGIEIKNTKLASLLRKWYLNTFDNSTQWDLTINDE